MTRWQYAWCFSHGRLHIFDDDPWCTATWVSLFGTTEEEALTAKMATYGEARFLHQLPDDQCRSVIRRA